MGVMMLIDVSAETLRNLERLETSWKQLEARAAHFLFVLALDQHLATAPEGRETTRSRRASGKIVGVATGVARRRGLAQSPLFT
jgi:hypothetical protein